MFFPLTMTSDLLCNMAAEDAGRLDDENDDADDESKQIGHYVLLSSFSSSSLPASSAAMLQRRSEVMVKGKNIVWFLFVVGLFFVPYIVRSEYHQHLLIISGIYVLLALGLNLIIGYTGQVSLGHAAFYGMGAYTGSHTLRQVWLPFLGSTFWPPLWSRASLESCSDFQPSGWPAIIWASLR